MNLSVSSFHFICELSDLHEVDVGFPIDIFVHMVIISQVPGEEVLACVIDKVLSRDSTVPVQVHLVPHCKGFPSVLCMVVVQGILVVSKESKGFWAIDPALVDPFKSGLCVLVLVCIEDRPLEVLQYPHVSVVLGDLLSLQLCVSIGVDRLHCVVDFLPVVPRVSKVCFSPILHVFETPLSDLKLAFDPVIGQIVDIWVPGSSRYPDVLDRCQPFEPPFVNPLLGSGRA